MFFLFHGDDKIKARAVAQKNIAAAQKKHPEASFFKLSVENFSADKLEELIAGQGLFYSAFVVLVDNICDETETAEIFLKKAKELKESKNFFVVLETKLNKKELEKLSKYAEKVEEFKLPEKRLSKKEALAAKGEKIDFFEFANALGEKDKRGLWSLYQEALNEGVPSEEVHGIFFWQVRSMICALKSDSPAESGLNPFVYSKAKTYAKKYGEERLKEMSASLFEMYHRAHRGEIDFAVSLEAFILRI